MINNEIKLTIYKPHLRKKITHLQISNYFFMFFFTLRFSGETSLSNLKFDREVSITYTQELNSILRKSLSFVRSLTI